VGSCLSECSRARPEAGGFTLVPSAGPETGLPQTCCPSAPLGRFPPAAGMNSSRAQEPRSVLHCLGASTARPRRLEVRDQ